VADINQAQIWSRTSSN